MPFRIPMMIAKGLKPFGGVPRPTRLETDLYGWDYKGLKLAEFMNRPKPNVRPRAAQEVVRPKPASNMEDIMADLPDELPDPFLGGPVRVSTPDFGKPAGRKITKADELAWPREQHEALTLLDPVRMSIGRKRYSKIQPPLPEWNWKPPMPQTGNLEFAKPELGFSAMPPIGPVKTVIKKVAGQADDAVDAVKSAAPKVQPSLNIPTAKMGSLMRGVGDDIAKAADDVDNQIPELGRIKRFGADHTIAGYPIRHPFKAAAWAAAPPAALYAINRFSGGEDPAGWQPQQIPLGADMGAGGGGYSMYGGTASSPGMEMRKQALADMQEYYNQQMDQSRQMWEGREAGLDEIQAQTQAYNAATTAQMRTDDDVRREANDEFNRQLKDDMAALGAGADPYAGGRSGADRQRLQGQTGAMGSAQQEMTSGMGNTLDELILQQQQVAPMRHEQQQRRLQSESAEDQRQLMNAHIKAMADNNLNFANSLAMKEVDYGMSQQQKQEDRMQMYGSDRQNAYAQALSLMGLGDETDISGLPPVVQQDLQAFLNSGNTAYLNRAQQYWNQYTQYEASQR